MVLGRARADARKERETQEEAPEKCAKAPRKDPGKRAASSPPPRSACRSSASYSARVDAALADPQAYARNPQETSRLSQQRAELADALAGAEEQWLKLADEAESASG